VPVWVKQSGIGPSRGHRSHFLCRLQRRARQDHRPARPQLLGIDERLFTRKKGYATTFWDLKNHRIYDVTLGRSEAALESCPALLSSSENSRSARGRLDDDSLRGRYLLGLEEVTCRRNVKGRCKVFLGALRKFARGLAVGSELGTGTTPRPRRYPTLLVRGVGRMWRFTRSNGITEGLHNKMETISRQAYGFRNFENYRRRVQALCA
jgi:hypothetical protein